MVGGFAAIYMFYLLNLISNCKTFDFRQIALKGFADVVGQRDEVAEAACVRYRLTRDQCELCDTLAKTQIKC